MRCLMKNAASNLPCVKRMMITQGTPYPICVRLGLPGCFAAKNGSSASTTAGVSHGNTPPPGGRASPSPLLAGEYDVTFLSTCGAQNLLDECLTHGINRIVYDAPDQLGIVRGAFPAVASDPASVVPNFEIAQHRMDFLNKYCTDFWGAFRYSEVKFCSINIRRVKHACSY